MGTPEQGDGSPPDGPAQPTLDLVPYDTGWPVRFQQTRAALATVFTHDPIAHVGSTSVPGLASKDTIDVLVGVDDVVGTLTPEVLTSLHLLGFEHRPRSFADVPDHAFLHRVVDGRRLDHVHVMRRGSRRYEDRLLLRDFLRREPGAARGYERAKLALLAGCGHRRYDYVDHKVAIVDALVVEARAWARRTGWDGRDDVPGP